MARSIALDWVLVAGLAAGGAAQAHAALAAAGGEPPALTEAAAAATTIVGSMADMEIRYIQVDGPESGHVRVELTPEIRPLTIFEARSAAQQGFLAALTEPGLGDDISRITVVVRLMPASHPDPAANELSLLFLHKGGRDWSILSAD